VLLISIYRSSPSQTLSTYGLTTNLWTNSASLEFLRLVTPATSSGKAIIDRCLTDESILRTELIDEIPDDHRPDDQYIAARLRVDHEFRMRFAASLQRKVKRNFQGGMGTGYTTADEVWSHFKPTEEELEKWINQEDRGEKRIDEDDALNGDCGDATIQAGEQNAPDNTSRSDHESTLVSDDGRDRRVGNRQNMASPSDGSTLRDQQDTSSTTLHNDDHHIKQHRSRSNAPTTATTPDDDSTTSQAPPSTWLGMLPALKDGPQQG
jgi:platelet-activating factor acetylhydrolase